MTLRVAIAGVGNCANALIQGITFYRDAADEDSIPGLMHTRFGPYAVRDIEFVAAFDVDAKKVGFDLSDAINNSENNTIRICDVPPTGVTVQRGPTLDGLGKYYRMTIEESAAEPVDVVQVLKDNQVDVLVSYLPVGSEEADKFYAQCAIDAGVAFVNALPVFIAGTKEWADKFTAAGVPIIPMAIWGAQEVLPRYSKRLSLFPRKTIHVKVGDPVDLSEFRGRPLDSSTLAAATNQVMLAITQLTADLRGSPAVGSWISGHGGETVHESGRRPVPGRRRCPRAPRVASAGGQRPQRVPRCRRRHRRQHGADAARRPRGARPPCRRPRQSRRTWRRPAGTRGTPPGTTRPPCPS